MAIYLIHGGWGGGSGKGLKSFFQSVKCTGSFKGSKITPDYFYIVVFFSHLGIFTWCSMALAA